MTTPTYNWINEQQNESQRPTFVGHVLIVDDFEPNRDVLVRRLQHLGCTTEEAVNGGQALERLRSGNFDLVLLDIMMPVMSGYEVLETMKQDEQLSRIPVVVISAVDDMASIARCIELGAEDFLTKPIEPIVLKARTLASIEKKRLRDAEQDYLAQLKHEKQQISDLLDLVIPIGADLAAEPDFGRLLVKIVESGRIISHADAGILYLKTERDTLEYVVVSNAAVGLFLTAADVKPESLLPLGTSNTRAAFPAVEAIVSGTSILIEHQADLSSWKALRERDQAFNYQTQKLLALPLLNSRQNIIGVLEFTNARADDGSIIRFSAHMQRMLQALSRLAGAALQGYLEQYAESPAKNERAFVSIDHALRTRQVQEISETEYFLRLRANIQRLRERTAGMSETE